MPRKKNKKENQDYKTTVIRYANLFIGLIFISLAFNIFLYPNNIVFGGTMGISIITNYLFHYDAYIVIFILNVLLLLISYIFLGKKTSRASIIGSLLLPLLIALTKDLSINVLASIDTHEVLLLSIFGGLLYGIGAGLVFKAGFTTGGTDIINQIISKYLHVSMGSAMLMSDGLIVLIGGLFFKFNSLMYALIVLYLISVMSDKVLLGISDKKALYIITDQEESVKRFIIEEMSHSITVFNARGGFLKEKENVIMTVIPTNEYFRIKEAIFLLDPEAFITVTDAYEVYGGE